MTNDLGVKAMMAAVRENRKKRPPQNGPIDKIPRYDWRKDPNGYKDEYDRVPIWRCFHCGYQYNNYTKITAFCNICFKALAYLSGGYPETYSLVQRQLVDGRIRVPDGKTPKSSFV